MNMITTEERTPPKLGTIKRTTGIAGQISYTVTVSRDGEESTVETFVGSVHGGPVVWVGHTGHQLTVTDPGRFGSFGPEWVRRFFA